MANINQFKLLQQKCETYFNLLESELKKTIIVKKPSDKERFGFYLYILECVTKIKDIEDLVACITDTDFNKTIFNDDSNDFGMDAVYIDEEDNTINMFNSKYREKFNEEKKQSLNDVFISSKFTNAMANLDASGFEGKLKHFGMEIIECLNSKEVWKMKLFMVSNESEGIGEKEYDVEQLKKLYDLEIVSITLTEIANYMSLRPEPAKAMFVLSNDAILSYSESAMSSSKSYVVKLPALELIRITSNSSDLRELYSIEDYLKLMDCNLEYSMLFDNVRGFLGETKYNKGMIATLKKEPTKFFMYNNGLTITADTIDTIEINGKTKMKFEVNNIQVVNGGQTLRTLHKFKSMDTDNIDKYLSECEILVRIFKTGNASSSSVLARKKEAINTNNLTRNIAEYTNSQNAISAIELKSLTEVQLQIEQFMDENAIIYARKIGDTGIEASKKYLHKISMEKFAQILFSMKGFPNKASNQKKKLFEKYYDDIFGDNNFNIDTSADYVKRYYEIKGVYESNQKGFTSTDQKIFYILYIDTMVDMPILNQIEYLESLISEYRKDEQISAARKLIENKFLETVKNDILKK